MVDDISSESVAHNHPTETEPSATGSTTTQVKSIVVGQSVVDIHGAAGSSDDEEANPVNRIGDIPLEWYDGESHMGYGLDGQRLAKTPQSAIDTLLFSVERGNIERYKTIIDRMHNNQMISLSSDDLEILHNIQNNRFPSSQYNPYSDLPPDDCRIAEDENPFTRGTVSKKVYLPRPRSVPKKAENVEDETSKVPTFDTDIWQDSWKNISPRYIAAPPISLPGTSESYNPPLEFFPTESEYAAISAKNAETTSLRTEHQPVSFDCLRHVPWYANTLAERYQRCLDLFCFPRIKRQKLQIANPDDLLPRLPAPRELRPYPEILAMEYHGHKAAVRSLSISSTGQWLATGCDDHILRVFEVSTGRLVKQYDLRAPVVWVQFGPSAACPYLAAAVENEILFFAASVASVYNSLQEAPEETDKRTRKFQKAFSFAQVHDDPLRIFPEDETDTQSATVDTRAAPLSEDSLAKFIFPKSSANGLILSVRFHAPVQTGKIHHAGDYVAVVVPKDAVRQRRVVLLNLETQKALCPFKLRTLCKDGTQVIDCNFFENEPYFLVVTASAAYIFDLEHQSLIKKLRPGVRTSLVAADVHPVSGQVVCSSLGDVQRSIMFFDSTGDEKPLHKFPSPFPGSSMLSVMFHRNTRRHPLLALGSTAGRISIFHIASLMDSEIVSDTPMLIPLRNLRFQSGSSVVATVFHPILPWIFTSSEKGEVTAWVEL